jgi:hypothetical protein
LGELPSVISISSINGVPLGPNGVQSREAPGRCKEKWGKPSYNDLESGLILGHKRRLNIKFPKETAFTMMRSTDGAINATAHSAGIRENLQ